ncbi:MAG: radical SAM protein, partial [Bacteroidota bacterium]
MNKVLISHSYFYRFDQKQWNSKEPYPPLMTIIAAALMRRNGYEVKLFDSCLEESEAAIVPMLDSFKPDFFIIFDDGFNYLTKMCLTTMREAAFRMQQLAKTRGAVTITCSSDSTDHLEKYLKNGADFIIKGEGEVTLEELVNTIKEGKSPEGIKGISYTKDGQIVTNPPRGVNRNLDELPAPAWDLIDVASYREIWQQRKGPFYLNIATTRGCPYKCNWCAKPIYGNRYNVRSPKLVADEIQGHVQNHGVDHFWM